MQKNVRDSNERCRHSATKNTCLLLVSLFVIVCIGVGCDAGEDAADAGGIKVIVNALSIPSNMKLEIGVLQSVDNLPGPPWIWSTRMLPRLS